MRRRATKSRCVQYCSLTSSSVVPFRADEVPQIKAPPEMFHAMNSILAPKTNLVSSEVVQMPSNPSEDMLDPMIEKQLDDFEDRLESQADCVRMWRGA